MPSAKSFARYAPALLALVAVLAFAPTAVTASPKGTPQSHVTWHLLKLARGYVSEAGDGMRPPSYGTNGTGVVYLAGAVCESPPLGAEYFAILPKPLRPAHDLLLPAWNGNPGDGPVQLGVAHNGWLSLGGRGCENLTGVSFVIGE
jgi:hypothetical protein